MKSKTRLTFICSAVACSATLTPSAHAGGLFLYEIGTPDVGLASAGYASRVQDASTVFRNPAGMSFLDGAQVQGGLQLTYGNVEFSPNSSTTVSGNDGGNAIGALPAGGLFLSVPLSEKFSVGLAGLSYFGLVENYDDNWVGRYYVQESALLGMSVMPSASFKATDWLSIGAGLNAMYGLFNAEVAVNNREAVLPGRSLDDGDLSMKDRVWGFGANVGVLIEPRKGTRVGVTYLSPVDLDFEDAPTFSNLGPGLSALVQNPRQLNLGVEVPQSVMLSLYQELNPRWGVMADFGWQNWNRFGKVEVGVETGNNLSVTKDLNYQDTWHGALGAQYKATEKWMFTGGVAFDSSAVDSAHRTVTLPMGQNWRFGLGAIYQFSQKINMGLAYEFMWGGDMPVDQGTADSLRGRVSGSYNDSWFSFVSLNMNWKF